MIALPGLLRFKLLDVDDERNSVIHFRENAAKMAVPSVTMHEIGIDVRGVEIDAAADRTENRFQWFWASEIACVELEAGDLEILFLKQLITEATDFHWHRLGELVREVTDMHARATVNMRWIFVGEEKEFHASI